MRVTPGSARSDDHAPLRIDAKLSTNGATPRLGRRCGSALTFGSAWPASGCLISWKTEELAPGWAEKVLLWHEQLHERVPAAEYASRLQQAERRRTEEEHQRAERQHAAQFEAEMGDAEPLLFASAEDSPPPPLPAAPYECNVMYEPYDDGKIQECLDDWRSDKPERKAAKEALFELSANLAQHAQHVPDGDLELQKLRRLQSDLAKGQGRRQAGGGYWALLRNAGLPANSPPEKTLMLPLKKELRKLRPRLLTVPRNQAFVERHRERLRSNVLKEHRGLSAMEVAHKLEVKLFSLLMQTREDEVLRISVGAIRVLNRSRVGAAAFDALPPERRDSGALVLDGHMPELMAGVTGAEAIEAGTTRSRRRDGGRYVSGAYTGYTIAFKPNFGLQDQPVASAVKARAALRQAIADYPAVRDAVEAVRQSAGDDDSD